MREEKSINLVKFGESRKGLDKIIIKKIGLSVDLSK